MASSGRKGKKKGTVISLQSFLENADAPAGTTQVAKKIRNIDGDESDDGSSSMSVVVQLPTAPRASRIFDDDSVPHKAPFIASLSNLPFDANEDDIENFFYPMKLISLRLPREDGETGRVRGFGNVEFESRDDLIHALSLPDPSMKGRRIRIDLPSENDQQGGRHNRGRRGFDGFGNNNSEYRESGNWRRDNQNQDHGGNNFDRGFNRDRKNNTEDNNTPGSWRTGNRPLQSDPSPRRDIGQRGRNYDREDRNKSQDLAQERPKLNLKPRTLPLPEIVSKSDKDDDLEIAKIVKPVGVAPEKVFGAAKPVDTAAREREIEERLEEAKRQEKIRREKEQIEVTEKVSELHIDKCLKDDTNTAISWRTKTDNVKTEGRKYSPERNDRRRERDQNRDYNRSDKSRYIRSDRSEGTRPKVSQNGKQQRDEKPKRDPRPERPMPKYQTNQSGPVLETSNKYSGLDDESSD